MLIRLNHFICIIRCCFISCPSCSRIYHYTRIFLDFFHKLRCMTLNGFQANVKSQSAPSIGSAYPNNCVGLKTRLWANAASLPPFVLHFGFTLGGRAWNVCPPAKKFSPLTLSHKVPLNFCGTDLEEFSVLNIPRLEDARLNCWRTWVGQSWVTCVGFQFILIW